MRRPTIRDLAATAGVSVSTVNRVIGGGVVRQSTVQRIRDAAEAIGFYGIAAIEHRAAAAWRKYRFGFLLQQPGRAWYRGIAQALRDAAGRAAGCDVELRIEFLDELAPQNVAERMLAMGEACEAIGVVAAVHPRVTQAIEQLQQRGVPVFALISQLAATGEVHYIGLDNWKVGRTAAWMFHQACRSPGPLAILVGNHRYRCQELNESGFRSYFREHAPDFALLEPLATFESATVAQELTERLLARQAALAGLYVAGGGLSGVLSALRASQHARDIAVVGYELTDTSRAALLDGILTMVISHPIIQICDAAISSMIAASQSKPGNANFSAIFPFEIYTRENI